MSLLQNHLASPAWKPIQIGILAGLFLLSVAGAFYLEHWMPLLIPFGFIALSWGLQDYRLLYLLIWAFIPFAIEVDLPGGFSTDFPAEPFMWLACLLFPVWLFLNHRETDFRFIFHPLFLLLVFHFFWIIITAIISIVPVISAKYTLAKGWYLVCFVLLPLLLLRKSEDYKTLGLFLFIPLVATIVIILFRHSQTGFAFSTINPAVIPIYRNHVDYACCLGILIPFAWYLRRSFESIWIRRFFWIALVLMLTGIYFSYTRAAWVCVPLAIGSFYVIRLRLIRILVPFILAGSILFIGWLMYENKYIEFSPQYDKAISHQNFDALLSATTKMEDISTVERFYRWLAGYYMVQEKPWTGFGPSSFYSVYHNFVDRHFTTFVSDNPEHSGIHNYYLMVAVEQGLIGILLFLVLVIAVLLYGEKQYHVLPSGGKRELLMAALVSFCCNLFVLTLNDMVETDKLGSIFFLCIAIVIMTGMGNEKPSVSQQPTGDTIA